MLRSKFKTRLKAVLKKYIQEVYTDDNTVFDELTAKFSDAKLSVSQQTQLRKFMLFFFLGQLCDLPTLSSVLSDYNIKSNSIGKKFKKLYKDITIGQLLNIFEEIFEKQIYTELKRLMAKDSSCLSRDLVTVVLDDSVFRQWLKSFRSGEDYGRCYGCFFSGQTHSSVYGFRNLCLGVVISGIYYPLYFSYVRNVKKEDNGGKVAALQAAEALVGRFKNYKADCAAQGLDLPSLHLSCDNGYSDADLADSCKDAGLIYISVPKKIHIFNINGCKIKLSEWIKQYYEKAEQAHNEAQKHLPEAKRKAFVYRFKGTYVSRNQKVTLIAFRLKGSKKISVVYSTSATIFAKTLRRHWFQRTYIEQFFKILKHMLKIQESRTKNKDEFTFKFLRFAFIGLQVQKMIRFIRKRMKAAAKTGFVAIQRILKKDNEIATLLQNAITVLN